MMIEKLKKVKMISDDEFDSIYPVKFQKLSERHWTPIRIATIVSDFLCYEKGLKILDIGSGVGKFCLIGSSLKSECDFYGVDFRKKFIDLSDNLKNTYRIKNVHFINKDILNFSLTDYNCIYFYNSFQERIDDTAVIDHQSELSFNLYRECAKYFFNQLMKMPIGTRLATYHTADFFVPGNYRLVETSLDKKLKLYIKSQYDFDFNLTFQEDRIFKHTLTNALL
jgi:SAM-dependent methyltransferase